jgi:hypothetical protein
LASGSDPPFEHEVRAKGIWVSTGSASGVAKCYRLSPGTGGRETMAGTDLEHMQVLPDIVRAAGLQPA